MSEKTRKAPPRPADKRKVKTGADGKGVGSGYAWEPTKEQRETAKFLFGCGATQQQVALHLGVSIDSCRTHLRSEFEWGTELANLALHGKLYEKAMKGDTACLIFLAKNRLGMTDKPWWMHPGANPHPNDIPKEGREELCVTVTYRRSNEPQALAPPPPDRLPPPVEAEAKRVA